MKILKNLPKSRRFFEKNNSQGVTLTRHELRPSQDTKHSLDLKLEKQCNSSSCEKSLEERQNSLNKASRLRGKRVICSKCGEYILKRVIRLHKKYYCGRKFDEKEWKLSSSLGLCLRCNKGQEPDSIEFHVKYMCGKNPITVQCFYCPRLFEDYKFLLKHMNTGHKKRHCFLDLISVLPVAESTDTENTVPKVVKNFFSNMLNTEHEAVVEDNDASISPCVQLRNKAIHKCNTCGKVLVGTHEYVNHVNTKCESENQYPCFYCDFRSVLAYEVLDHMEETHEKQFNTFDIIQARLTGIIPLIDPNVIDKTSNQSNSPGSKKVHFPEQVIEKIGEKVPKHELEITFKPDLKKAREHVKDVYMVSNEDAELINDKDRILRRGRLFHKDLNVEDKHAEFEIYSSSGEDVLTETGVNLRKQCKSANTGLNLKGQQIIQLDKVSEEDKPPEKSPISIADKENLAKSGNHSSDDHLFEIPPPFDPKELPSNTLVCDSSCSFEKDHKLNSKGSLGQLLYDEPLPQGEVENMEDKSTVEKPLSLIGCTSQEMCETESISQTDQSPNTYPAIAYPQLDFANKQLFVSYCSPARGLRSKSKQMAILKDKHTFEVRLSTEKNNSLKNEAGECMSSDSEVDFANKELFEPYLSPIKKRKKLTKVQSLRKGVRLSTSYSGQTSSDRAGKKETSPSMEIKSYASYSTNQTQKRNTKKVKNSSLKAKVGLKVTKRKMLINKKIIIATANKRKRCPITKINCSKCHEDVHPGDLRIHYKYHCLKHPTKKQWILCSGKALCLRCRKFQWSDSIDFHVKYLCNRKRFLLKCFYCSKIGKDYKSVIVHMHKAHGKKHYYQDLMSILPDSEVGSAEKTQIIKGEDTNSSKVIKHPITFHAVNKNDEGNNKELVDNLTDHSDDYYECFYCEFKHMMAYKTLDHMEDKHCKVHNLYDLLHAKMPQIEPEKGLLS